MADPDTAGRLMPAIELLIPIRDIDTRTMVTSIRIIRHVDIMDTTDTTGHVTDRITPAGIPISTRRLGLDSAIGIHQPIIPNLLWFTLSQRP